MLNPGSGASRKDGADEHLLQLIRAFADGSGSLDAVFEQQAGDMRDWGRGRFLPFYMEGLDLNPDETAIANVAWCSTRDNALPPRMLNDCFEAHTGELLSILQPDILLLSGSKTHKFAKRIRLLLPQCLVIPMYHFTHREGHDAEVRELLRVRSEMGAWGK